jgi:thiol-disulfide isomerase/thioredoxin
MAGARVILRHMKYLGLPLLALLLIWWSGDAPARAPVQLTPALAGMLSTLDPIGKRRLGRTEGKIVIVTFFASWCPPCRWEFESLNALRERYGEDDLAIVAINRFETWANDAGGRRMKRFLAETKPAFPLVAGTEALAERFGGIERIPTLFVFDRKGRQAYAFVHLEGAEKMHAGTVELVAVIDALR